MSGYLLYKVFPWLSIHVLSAVPSAVVESTDLDQAACSNPDSAIP